MDIGQFIKTRRLELNFSQRQMALSSGISNATISRIESGAVIPDAATLSKLAKALKLNPSMLFSICGYISGSADSTKNEVRPKMASTPRNFGARLKSLREEAGYSLEEFCEVTGYSPDMVIAWEAGAGQPGSGAVKELTDFFGVTTGYLLGKSDEKYPELRQRHKESVHKSVFKETQTQDIQEVLRELSKAVENAQRVLAIYSEKDKDKE